MFISLVCCVEGDDTACSWWRNVISWH